MSFDRRIQNPHATKYDTSKRYDLIILAKVNGFRLSDGMARSMILNLATEQWLKPFDEAIDENWVEVYCNPGPSAHNMFTRSTFDDTIDVFEEAAIYFGQQAVEIEYGSKPFKVYFYIEFRGCLFNKVHGDFRKRLTDAFNLRGARFLSRKAQDIPPRRDVEEEPVVG